MDGFLLLCFVFLVGGIVAVPIATRLGLGSVLGFLIAGIVLSPILQTLQVDVVSIQHFAEFGVVMMLFLVGLELEPKTLWRMRAKLLGLGGLQVALTAAAVMGFAMLWGQAWNVALAIGFVMALSSTAIVLQTLNEKGLMKSDGGQASFSVLLFQDIAVIPMLALLPLLAIPELVDLSHSAGSGAQGAEAAHASGGHGSDEHAASNDHGSGDHGSGLTLVDGLPGWLRALVTLLAISAVVIGGSLLTRPVFRFVAMARLRELFTATALMMVVGIALLMTLVGLSPALGTFLAGVVLANSEYRHELESDIGPFKGLLLGLFFMTVGAAIDFQLLFSNFGTVLGITIGVMLLKALILLFLARIFKVQGSDKWLFGLGLAQAGEFGFVLLSFTVANNVIPTDVASILLLAVALSMLLTPGLFILYDRVIVPRYGGSIDQEPDDIDEQGEVIIAGHGRFGGIVNRMLRASGYETVVLDYSSAQLEMLRTFGVKVFYGDATRPDLLHSAGIAEARMLVIALDDEDKITELTRYVRMAHPHVHIVARAIGRHHVYDLYAAGARDVIRETFDSSVRAGRSALIALGAHPYEAEKQSREFVRMDRKILREMASLWDPDVPIEQNAPYVERTKEMVKEREEEMHGGPRGFTARSERGWTPPSLIDLDEESRAARSET